MTSTPKLCKSIEHLVDTWGPIEGRTRLLKLVYLADLEWAQKHGNPYTEAKYYRWNHGPFSRELLKAVEWMDGIEIVESSEPWDRGETYCYRPGKRTRLGQEKLHPDFVALLDEIGERWRNRPLRELLDHVYGGEQFREKAFGQTLM
jgi:Protein of unknown function (DUF4065)